MRYGNIPYNLFSAVLFNFHSQVCKSFYLIFLKVGTQGSFCLENVLGDL